MHINTQIARGMERLMANAEANRVQGLYGLAGFDDVDTFDELDSLLGDVGMAGVGSYMDGIRRRHSLVCDRMKRALPVAVDAMRLVEANPGVGVAGILSKVKKAVKKVGKVAAKLSPSHQLVKKVAPKALLLSPTHAMLTSASAPGPTAAQQAEKAAAEAAAAQAKIAQAATDAARAKAEKSAAAKAARAATLKQKAEAAAAKKQAKLDEKAAKKAAKAAEALAKTASAGMGIPVTPEEAGKQVLANESGVKLTSPAAQQFAQEVLSNAAQPGSTIPAMSMFSPSGGGGGEAAPSQGEEAPADGGFFANLSPAYIIGGIAVAGGALYLFSKGKR